MARNTSTLFSRLLPHIRHSIRLRSETDPRNPESTGKIIFECHTCMTGLGYIARPSGQLDWVQEMEKDNKATEEYVWGLFNEGLDPATIINRLEGDSEFRAVVYALCKRLYEEHGKEPPQGLLVEGGGDPIVRAPLPS